MILEVIQLVVDILSLWESIINLDTLVSLIYKNFYKYDGEEVRNSFDLSLGVTYSFTKDFSCSIKGENLLDKSTKSLYTKGFSKTDFALNNDDRRVIFSMKWVF